MDTDTQTSQAQDPIADTPAPEATSEASTQVEETPEAAPVQETDVNATDTVEEALLAGKYKSPEELEKAYKELESKYGQTSSEKAELSRILNEAFLSPEPQVPQVQANDDLGEYEESNPLQREVEQLKQVSAVQSFIIAHPDADAAAMQQVLNNDPIVKQIPSAEAKLEYALLRSQNMSQQKAIAEAKKTAAQATQTKIVEKQAAQVEPVQSSEQVDEKSELKARMATGSLQDREAARREYIRKFMV